jgi:predicted DNA-binding transcriptional regulator AlpA
MPQAESASAEYIRAKTLASRLDCGESTIWRMVQRGLLPQPAAKIGQRTTLWKWADVEKHLAARPADGGAA